MRRARQPWKVLGTGVAVATVLVVVTSVALRAVGADRYRKARAAIEERWGPLDPASFDRRLPDSSNAAAVLREAAAAVVLEPGEKNLVAASLLPDASWGEERIVEVREVVARNRQAIETMARVRDPRVADWGIPKLHRSPDHASGLIDVLEGFRVLALDGRLAAVRGDLDTAVDRAEQVGRGAESLFQGATLIHHLVGLEVEHLRVTMLGDAVSSPSLNPGQLDRVASAIGEVEIPESLRRALRGEIGVFLHTGDPTPLDPPAAARWSGLWDLVLAAHMEQMIPWFERAGRPYGEDPSDFRHPPVPSWWRPADRLATVFMPDLVSVNVRGQLVAARRHLLATAVEARRHAAETGAYPVAPPASMLRPDPFTAEPPAWQVGEDGSARLWLPTAPALAEDHVRERALESLARIELPPPDPAAVGG